MAGLLSFIRSAIGGRETPALHGRRGELLEGRVDDLQTQRGRLAVIELIDFIQDRRGHVERTDVAAEHRKNGRVRLAEVDENTGVDDQQPQPPGDHDSLQPRGCQTSAAVVTYKVAQMFLDEDFGSRAYPASFRAEKIGAHLDAHGSRCLRCDRGVRVRDLTVDHIVPWAKGGLTSRFNAAVICGPCNSSKGAAANLMDYLRGRRA